MQLKNSLAAYICIVLALSSAQVHSKCDTDRIYGYSNLGRGDGIIIDEKRHSVLIGDTGVNATFCNTKSGFYCVNSKYFNFAVPTEVSSNTQSWHMGNYEYKVLLPLKSKVLFDSDVHILLIGQYTIKDEHIISYYYFSPTLGLLGITTFIPEKLRLKIFGSADIMIDTMISSNKIGFGAACTED